MRWEELRTDLELLGILSVIGILAGSLLLTVVFLLFGAKWYWTLLVSSPLLIYGCVLAILVVRDERSDSGGYSLGVPSVRPSRTVYDLPGNLPRRPSPGVGGGGYGGGSRVCPLCGGKGETVMPAFGSPSGREWMMCTRCQGRGTISGGARGNCLRCGGSGYLAPTNWWDKYFAGTGGRCPVCHGSGTDPARGPFR